MRKYLFIAVGGMFGAILRFAAGKIQVWDNLSSIPLNTLFVNITGSFLLALFLTIAFEVWKFNSDVRLGVGTGFFGAYTTFSTLCKQTVNLIADGEYYSALSYMTVSVMLGLAAAYFGVIFAREVISKLPEGRKEEQIEGQINRILKEGEEE